MDITIIGAGKIGKTLIRHLLSEGHDITVIDSNSKVVEECINSYDVLGVYGNGASLDIQKEANVASTDLVIAVTSSDELNMLCCIVAKKLGAKQTIARVRNYEYAHQTYLMRDELGLDKFVNPELSAAQYISRLLRFPSALKFETFSNGKVDVAMIKIDSQSILLSKKLSELHGMLGLRFLVCGVSRNGDVIIPNGDFVIEEGDEVYICASASVISTLFKKLNIFKSKSKEIMIIGGGRIAFYLANMLEDEGMSVKIIEQDKERCEELASLLHNTLIINGDATSLKLLEEENYASMDSIVTLTGFDEENMFISLACKKAGVEQVITKINRTAFTDIFTDTALDCVVNPQEITADNIVRYARGMRKNTSAEFRTLYRFMDGKVEGIEFLITSNTKYTNIPFKDLKVKKGVLIGAIIRENNVIIPNGDDMLLPHDTVIVFGSATQISDLNDILG